MARLLIVDDGKNIRSHLATYFEGRGHQVRTAESGREALGLLGADGGCEVVLTDYRMAEMNGLELLSEIKRIDPSIAVILMTAYGTVQNAVAAMKAGAHDYLSKPFSLDQIAHVVERAIEMQRLRAENRLLLDAVEMRPLLESGNAAMRRVLKSVEQAADAATPVLLMGESGTGKSVLARQIHRWSKRRENPFVVVNCTTLAEHLLESELFGHVRGAFNGATKEKPGRLEAAAGGTVFLDEIAELGAPLQAKFMRFAAQSCFERIGGDQTIQVDTRIVAASTRDLPAEVAALRFRSDLFYRLNVITLTVPPLRERSEDILALADRFLAAACVYQRRTRLKLAPEAAAALERYRWPGNVRELRNAIERAAVLARTGVVAPEHLPDALFRAALEERSGAPAVSLEELERMHIVRVLAEAPTLEDAAETLGINVATLWRKRKRYGID
jgi:DNA-binding NtrC family response regulator